MNATSRETQNNSQNEEAGPAPGSTVPGNMRLRAMLWSATGALIALAGVALFLLWTADGNRRADPPVIGEAPHYRLTNQNGKPVSSQDLSGKVQIVTVAFPYCRELCPLVAANLAEFRDNVVQQTDLKGHVVFVFFNVAPADTGPAEMRAFLKQYGWNPDDPAVEFLTGSPNEVERVVQRGYHIAYYRTQDDDGDQSYFQVKNALADRDKPTFDVKHADTIEIVDGAGRVRKIFTDGSRLEDIRLQSAIAPLLTDGSAAKPQNGG